jgi:hypothetical protein
MMGRAEFKGFFRSSKALTRGEVDKFLQTLPKTED